MLSICAKVTPFTCLDVGVVAVAHCGVIGVGLNWASSGGSLSVLSGVEAVMWQDMQALLMLSAGPLRRELQPRWPGCIEMVDPPALFRRSTTSQAMTLSGRPLVLGSAGYEEAS